MTMRMPDLRRRAALVGFVAIALLAVPMAASAGTLPDPPPDSSTGRVGVHGFAEDTEGSPAGRCRYGYMVAKVYFNHLRRIGVDAPVAYAREGRVTQRIGFRLVVQEWNGSAWVVYARSSWSFKNATPDTPADFSPRTMSFPADISSHTARSKVKLRWYAGDGVTVTGRAIMFPEWYEAWEHGLSHVQHERCGGTTG
jgi:hypothetical protein